MRRSSLSAIALPASLLLLPLLLGCEPVVTQQPPANITGSHDHGHSHEELGPNGGHLVELGEEEYHLEWTHDDASGLVTLYVLDSSAKERVPIDAESITISVRVEKTTDYKLLAADPSGESGQSAEFSLKSAELLTMLKMAGQGSEPKAYVSIAGKEFVGVFEHHDHSHGHHH